MPSPAPVTPFPAAIVDRPGVRAGAAAGRVPAAKNAADVPLLTLLIEPRHHPLTSQLLTHALSSRDASARKRLIAAYEPLPERHYDAVETALTHVLRATGRSLAQCLADLDRFNALTPETENDAWYDDPAAFTSMHLDSLLLGFSRRRLLQLADQVCERSRRLDQVLEVGCGFLAAGLNDRQQGWHLHLVDRSAEAVRFVAAYHRERGTAHRVRCAHGDLGALPAHNASMDVVIAAEVLEHAPDAEAAVAELLRVLRPGGWLAVSLPVALDIAMHPTVFADEAAVRDLFVRRNLKVVDLQWVRPDPDIDAIATVFPGFAGCINAMFRKPAVHD